MRSTAPALVPAPLLALLVCLLAGLQGPKGDAPPGLAEAQALASAGKNEEALTKAEEGLELAPTDPRLLALAARAAADLERKDEALWYALLALDEVRGQKDWADLEKDLTARIAALDPLAGSGRAALDRWAGGIYELGKAAASKKLWINAVDLLARLDGTSYGERAAAELARIYDNKKAVAELLESGLDVPLRAKKKRSPEAIARDDQKHVEWDNRWVIKGANYTIETNMGKEMADSMSLAMEQMNGSYRSIFGVREHGGNTARCTIYVYRSRAEFDEFEGKKDPGIRGFFVPGMNRVATYDPRTDGMSLGFLWVTLFHESSHQFTHMISADLIPAWLNEGTASYFEGARLMSNGSVESNLVPEHRLSALKALFQRKSPTLKDVVSFFEPGSYPGEYYPFGWGLVYFLHNYEDENCVRVYLPLYEAYMASYKTGGKHDPFQRFVDFFVTKAKQPGIATFEDFDVRFQKWILDLHDVYFGHPDKADLLIGRARKQRENKQNDAAIESYRWAVRKRPGDPLANFELAELQASQKRKDDALFRLRDALETLAAMDPDARVAGPTEFSAKELAARCRERMAALDKDFAVAWEAAQDKGSADVQLAAKAYAEKEFPRAALASLATAREIGGPGRDRETLAADIRKQNAGGLARWRRIAVPDDLAGWEASAAWKAEDGELNVDQPAGRGPTFCTWRGDPARNYRFQVHVQALKLADDGVLGLIFGANDNSMRLVCAFASGNCRVAKLDQELEVLQPLPNIAAEQLQDFVLSVDVLDDHADFYVGDKKVGTLKATLADLSGRIGVFIQSGKARFSELKVRQ